MTSYACWFLFSSAVRSAMMILLVVQQWCVAWCSDRHCNRNPTFVRNADCPSTKAARLGQMPGSAVKHQTRRSGFINDRLDVAQADTLQQPDPKRFGHRFFDRPTCSKAVGAIARILQFLLGE